MTLALHAATVKKRTAEILRDVTLTCEAGQLSVICGPNGAGKTTALSLLTGAEQPSRGKATLDGTELRTIARGELARRRAVVAQQHRLNFPFQVEEVVAMGRAPHEGRTSPAQDRAIRQQAMELLDLTHMADRNYLTLSGGEKQRVMIARALVQVWEEPEGMTRWLLLDEPTAALDLKYQLLLMKRLVALAADGWGILAILHDLPLVKAYADHVILLKDGALVNQGSPDKVLTPTEIANAYGLDEPYNLD
ncbi:MAG: heme ABC transporter ATP-binding protein [Pseudomonadota bacterium]